MPAIISRRSFFQKLRPSSGGNPAFRISNVRSSILSSNLDPFVPDADNPWDEIRAGHLLRRTMMSPAWADIEALVKLGDPGKAVDLLLSQFSTPAEPSSAESLREDPTTQANSGLQQTDISNLESDAGAVRAWWAKLQQSARQSIQEKMVFFWSCHFTTAFDLGSNYYVTAPLLYRQNNLFRTFGNIENGAQNGPLGNFKDLVKAVTLDGAMLVYLGGNQSVESAPNENYARELMELFTCGLGGGYTQADVEAGARILTGWKIPQFTQVLALNGNFVPYFWPTDHDTQDKTYLTQDFPAIDIASDTEYLVKQNEVNKMIDVLFEETGQAIATFISSKIYQFFVYSDPSSVDMGVVSAMADLFIQNNWEIMPVMSALLKSEHFFDNLNIGAQIKTPAEYDIGIARQLYPTFVIDSNMTAAGQQFFQPPNVSGWPGYHDWITTNSYPVRGDQATSAIAAIAALDASNNSATTLAFVNQFPTPSDANALATSIGQLLLPRELSSERQTTFASMLTGGSPTYEWPSILSSSPSTAARNVRNLLSYIISLPDFELC